MIENIENRSIIINVTNENIKLPKNIKEDIDKFWERIEKEDNNLFNGEIMTVYSCENTEDKIIINCKKTNYAHYLYDERIGCPNEFGNYGLSAGIFFETSDGYYVIGKLAKTTSFPEGLTIQGGAVDKKDIEKNGIVNIEATMRREAIEELNFDIKNKDQVENYEIKYISPATDKIKTYEIIYKGNLKLDSKEVRKHFEKYYKYLKVNNLEMEYEDIILLKKETALEELKKMKNPKRKYILDIIESDFIKK